MGLTTARAGTDGLPFERRMFFNIRTIRDLIMSGFFSKRGKFVYNTNK